MKERQATYITFSRSERNGTLILLALLLLLGAGRLLLRNKVASQTDGLFKQNLAARWETNKHGNTIHQVPTAAIDLNTADSIQLLSLNGVGPAIAHRILNRRQEKGNFKNYDQVWQLYHFSSATKEEILSKTTITK